MNIRHFYIATIIASMGAFMFAWSIQSESRPVGIAYKKMEVNEYRDKVYASWLGQLIGNIVGLPHENQYVLEHGEYKGPTDFTWPNWGSSEKVMLDVLKDYDGAFSDDDTDLEYMYLILMEKYGPEPSYKQIADAWKYHIRKRLWVANRTALGLMHYGYYPPYTGMKIKNFNWFQIDPQLVNEIWAITAPGMIDYSVAKSDWAARITNDDFGVEPTLFYGAMYSAAFFEDDIEELLKIGMEALGTQARFTQVVLDMQKIHQQYPNDWIKARAAVAEKYFDQEPAETKHQVAATINGAVGVLALLYGNGDFQKTLDMACLMGYDADNQAATMSGLLGVIYGKDIIPEKLLFPVEGWDKPLNNQYKNVSRYDLPDASIEDIVARTVKQGEKIILANGGKKIIEDGKEYYLINTEAAFIPPFEFNSCPPLFFSQNASVNFKLYAGALNPKFSLVAGSLPDGLELDGNTIKGEPIKPGNYLFSIEASYMGNAIRQEFDITVHGKNLANIASEIITNHPNDELDPELLRNGIKVAFRDYQLTGSPQPEGSRYGPNYQQTYTSKGSPQPKTDYYGYEWESEQKIGRVALHLGQVGFVDGWFNSLRVEYWNDRYKIWEAPEKFAIIPEMTIAPSSRMKPSYVEYNIVFPKVETLKIRVLGEAGGLQNYYTPVSELEIYEEF